MDLSPYDNIGGWFDKMKTSLPGYDEINEVGANTFGNIFKSKLS